MATFHNFGTYSSHPPSPWMPSAGPKRTSSPSGVRLGSSPLPVNSLFDSRPTYTHNNLSSRSLPRSSTMPIPMTTSGGLHRSNSSPVPWANTPLPPSSTTSTSNVTTAQPTRSHTPFTPRRPKTPAGSTTPERPPLLRHGSSSQSVPRATTPVRTASPEPIKDEDVKRATAREEMLRRVASEVESIEKETDEVARQKFESTRRGRSRGNSVLEPSTPPTLSRSSSLRDRPRPHARRGSIDSNIGAGWEIEIDPESPRSAKEWEKWAEDKVRTRRRLEEVWRKEESAFVETERLVQESLSREKSRREREARKEWDRQAFLEQERQRMIKESKDREAQRRMREMQELYELQEALLAEEKRLEDLERVRRQEARRIEEEARARRREEELQRERERKRLEETKRQEEERQRERERERQRSSSSQRAKSHERQRSREPRRKPSFYTHRQTTQEDIRKIFETNFDDDSDCTEWERLAAEFAKLTGSKSNRPTYKSSAASFKEAWESYESRWSKLSAPHPAGSLATATPLRLGFRDIPWPVLHQPTRAADLESHLTESHISSFILSSSHPTSGQQSSLASSPNLDSRTRRMRIREALLRWHPDKIARILASIQSDDERFAVKEGAEVVARHLNALLARDS